MLLRAAAAADVHAAASSSVPAAEEHSELTRLSLSGCSAGGAGGGGSGNPASLEFPRFPATAENNEAAVAA